MSIQHIWNLSRLLGLFNYSKLANLSWNSIARTSKQCSKTTRRKSCCEKLGTRHDVKSFAIGSFLERFVVKIADDYPIKWLLITLVKSVQNRFPAKFAWTKPLKKAIFYWLYFGEVSNENSHECVSENPAKFAFFAWRIRLIRSPVAWRNPWDLIVWKYRRQRSV